MIIDDAPDWDFADEINRAFLGMLREAARYPDHSPGAYEKQREELEAQARREGPGMYIYFEINAESDAGAAARLVASIDFFPPRVGYPPRTFPNRRRAR